MPRGVQRAMRSMPLSRRPVLSGLLAVGGALVLLVLVWPHLTHGPLSEVVVDPTTPEGWQTVQYDDLRVDVPAAWVRVDDSDCEFEYERWAREGSEACDFEDGVGFWGAVTFDPDTGPGVFRTTENGVPLWGGYVIEGESVVYVADEDRAVSRAVLDSVRRSGG